MIEKDFILLIPYFNNIAGLNNSIKSINYPSDLFEILLIDDGSEVELSLNKLDEFTNHLTINIIRLNKNRGIVNALNEGLKFLKDRTDFKYIARLDCDDICNSERFIEQVKFLNENSDIGLLGSWCRFINSETKKSYLYRAKTEHFDILREMHFKCSFIHPTVMFRKEILNTIGCYPNDYVHAEDYAYFWKILKTTKGAILDKELVIIEFSEKNISLQNYNLQIISRIKVINEFGNLKFLKMAGIFLLRCKLLLPKKMILWLKLRYLN
ncbi:MAG: hypothetical protein A2046_03705 [Bacteroidetes bacterium GWA2_30_7]|nr:MAG: hypothetical protein A2046_03705 [Bacteroidetes bacterium GWA2_30_7]